MPLLPEEVKKQVREALADLKSPVKFVVFTQTFECMYCRENRQLIEEVVGLSDKLSVEVYNLVTDAEKAKEYGVDKIPATAIVGDQDYGIRFYGIPSGYEFSTVIEDIMMVSRGESGLSEASKAQVAGLTQPLHLQVFVTPT